MRYLDCRGLIGVRVQVMVERYEGRCWSRADSLWY